MGPIGLQTVSIRLENSIELHRFQSKKVDYQTIPGNSLSQPCVVSAGGGAKSSKQQFLSGPSWFLRQTTEEKKKHCIFHFYKPHFNKISQFYTNLLSFLVFC